MLAVFLALLFLFAGPAAAEDISHPLFNDSEGYAKRMIENCSRSDARKDFSDVDGAEILNREGFCSLYPNRTFETHDICLHQAIRVCVKNSIEETFHAVLNGGQFAAPPCDDQLKCKLYFNFNDYGEQFLASNSLCGYNFDGIAQTDSNGRLTYILTISAKSSCFMS